MTRVAIYARYSTELQREASIEDQIRVCRERAEREGWQVVECYTDYAISGGSLLLRPGIQKMIQDAYTGNFDIIMSEALDRLSRDQEDIAGVYKRMLFQNIKLFTLSEGEINEMHIGFSGTMNAMFVKNLKDKVHRGMRGRVENGKSAGGLGYGYDVVKKFDANGNPIKGERKINEEKARIIKRIFEEYVQGRSPKQIAAQLNNEGVPGPTSKAWGPSSIYGNRRRGSGILNNETYIGQIVWNKVRMIKNPDTGRRISRENPESEWIRSDAPDLQIIDRELWNKAKKRQKELNEKNDNFWQKQRPQKLFSFLLKCGECGGGVSKRSTTHYACSSSTNKGLSVCTNRRRIHQDYLEHTVLSILQHKLMDPKLVKVFCEEYTKHINHLRMEHNASLTGYKSELEKLNKKEAHIIDAITKGLFSEALKDQMDQINNRKAELKVILENEKEAPVLLHPSMAIRYHNEVRNLIESLNDEKRRIEAAELIRSLIDKIVLTPDPNGKGLLIDLHGDLAGILNIAHDKKNEGCKEEDIKKIRIFTESNMSKTGMKDKVVSDPRYQLNFCPTQKITAPFRTHGLHFIPET